MKSKITFLSLFFICALSTIAQNMESLKTDALKYYKASTLMDYDALFATTYPKVFDIIPKESMKQMFQQMMDNEQFSIQLVDAEPNFTFGEIKKIGNQTFCLIDQEITILKANSCDNLNK